MLEFTAAFADFNRLVRAEDVKDVGQAFGDVGVAAD